ncbi:25276_t:CDS:1, partial [Dentiscutata erythropus]
EQQSSNVTNKELETTIKRKQRHLTKSEEEIFNKLIEHNKLLAEQTSRVLVEICNLLDTKPEDWDLKKSQSIWLRRKSAKKNK